MNVQELKEKLSIVDIVEEYTDLVKLGDEYRGKCCFHNDDNASLYVNKKKGVWKCFGCDLSGDIITFIQEIEGLDFKDAVGYLSGNEQVEFNGNYKNINNSLSLLDIQKKEKNHKLNEKLLNKYKKKQHGYLLNQGFDKEILKFFEVGFCQDPGDELYNRITIPWRNKDGELVAIVGRDITDKKDCKYKAKKGSHKNDYLYNLNNAKHYCNEGLIVVEDEKSVMKLWQWGYKNAVALGNKDLADRKWLLRQFTDTAILCFDSDKKGIEGRNKAVRELIPLMNIEVIKLPKEYKDAAEIKKKEEFDKYYENRDILNY